MPQFAIAFGKSSPGLSLVDMISIPLRCEMNFAA